MSNMSAGFTLIANADLTALYAMPGSAVKVFLAVQQRANIANWKHYAGEIARRTTLNVRTVQRALTALADAGLITATDERDESGRFDGRTYATKPRVQKERTAPIKEKYFLPPKSPARASQGNRASATSSDGTAHRIEVATKRLRALGIYAKAPYDFARRDPEYVLAHVQQRALRGYDVGKLVRMICSGTEPERSTDVKRFNIGTLSRQPNEHPNARETHLVGTVNRKPSRDDWTGRLPDQRTEIERLQNLGLSAGFSARIAGFNRGRDRGDGHHEASGERIHGSPGTLGHRPENREIEAPPVESSSAA